MSSGPPPTAGGHDAAEGVSALQKAIRRGEVENAVYWATELERVGLGAWVWKRLRIIVSEDVGTAWPEGPAVIDALYRTYVDLRRNRNPRSNGHRMPFVHAVVLLASAPKSRLVGWMQMVAYRGGLEHREVPDVALDRHTRRGRQRGGGLGRVLRRGHAARTARGAARRSRVEAPRSRRRRGERAAAGRGAAPAGVAVRVAHPLAQRTGPAVRSLVARGGSPG